MIKVLFLGYGLLGLIFSRTIFWYRTTIITAENYKIGDESDGYKDRYIGLDFVF